MGVEVEIRDIGMTQVARQLKSLDTAMTFGVHEDAPPYPDGTDTVVVASTHEFGTEDIPQRSFLRGSVDGPGKRAIGDAAQKSIGKIIDGAPVAQFVDDVGDVAVEGVRKLIKSGISPGLKDGSGRRPLDRSGHLIASIKAKAVED